MSPTDRVIEAVYRNDSEALSRLAAKGVDLNGRDEDGRTPLMHACLAQVPSPTMVRLLLEKGADPNLADSGQQWTALHFAARDQKEDVVKVLLDGGATVDAVDVFGNTALWRAVMHSEPNLGVTTVLLKYGASANKKNKHGVSPLDTAKRMGNAQLVATLEDAART